MFGFKRRFKPSQEKEESPSRSSSSDSAGFKTGKFSGKNPRRSRMRNQGENPKAKERMKRKGLLDA